MRCNRSRWPIDFHPECLLCSCNSNSTGSVSVLCEKLLSELEIVWWHRPFWRLKSAATQLVTSAQISHVMGRVKAHLSLSSQDPYSLTRLETFHSTILPIKSDGMIHELVNRSSGLSACWRTATLRACFSNGSKWRRFRASCW